MPATNPATGLPYTNRRGTALTVTTHRAAVPRPLASAIATTRDGRDITQPYITELQEARDPLLMHAIDWGLYDQIFRDDQVKSTFQQRVGALISREWDVVPGGEDERDNLAAEALKANISRLGIDRVTEKTLKAIFNGYSVTEIMWEYRDGMIQIGRLHVRHARRFRFDAAGRLRLLTSANMSPGELMPPRKFWVLTAGGDDDDEVYGRGLAYWLYWPTLFKRNGLKFWNTFLDKFGSPTAVGKFRPGTTSDDIAKLLSALQAIAQDSGFVIPEGMEVDLLEAARSGTADFAGLVAYMDGAIAKVVLSQVGTTENGKYAGTAATHADVKLEVVKADADMWADSFNAGPAKWWTDFNFPGAATPRFMRLVKEEEDLKKSADTDKILKDLGWERDDDSFIDLYGDGYRRVAPAEAPTPPDVDEQEDSEEDAAAFAEAALPGADAELESALSALAEGETSRDALQALTAPIVAALQAARDEEEAEAILDRLAETLPTADLTEIIARAGFAANLTAAADE